MAMYDINGRLVFANQGYEKLFGLAESEMKKIPPHDLMARFKERFHDPSLPDLGGRFLLEDIDNAAVKTTPADSVCQNSGCSINPRPRCAMVERWSSAIFTCTAMCPKRLRSSG